MARPSPDIRLGVRSVLQAAEGFATLPPELRREIAGALVRIASAATDLAAAAGRPRPDATPRDVPAPTARTLAAGDAFSGAAVDRIAPTTQRILKAVSFPRFVGELITGVFKAMNESNQEQLTAYVDLIKNVAATTEGFADANISVTAARNWLAERFAGHFEVRGGEDDGFDDPSQMTEEERREWQAERDADTRLVLAPGAEMPSEAALRTALGLDPGDTVPTGDPERLVPVARAAMARGRQETLASMVMMGLQRIVIDGGRLNASMRFHIDATSAAEDERGSRFDLEHESEAAMRAQFGPWGAAARMKNTIGYVSTERTVTEEAINAELDLDSSVELVFRTDYVPLERLAGADEVERIQLNSINPAAERQAASRPGEARATARRERLDRLGQELQPRGGGESEGPNTPLEVPGPSSAPVVPGIRAGSDTTSGDGATGAGPPSGETEGGGTRSGAESPSGEDAGAGG
jgi:hypothetical protein